MSTRNFAVALGRPETHSGLITRWEKGERRPDVDDIEKIAEVLDVPPEVKAELIGMVTSDSKNGGWLAVTLPERRIQLAALLAAERTATEVTHVAPLLIPGVLQTSDVIRAIMVEGGVPADEIDERVTMRIGRRELITRRNPAKLNVWLGEAALHLTIGGPETFANQLRYLLEMTELPNVNVRVVPFNAGWNPSLAGAFILVDSNTAASIVNIELPLSAVILSNDADIEACRKEADVVKTKALSADESTALIMERIKQLEAK